MEGLFNGFQTLIDTFGVILNFLKGIIETLINVPIIIQKGAHTLTAYIATMPGWVITYATITLSIIIVYQLIGRSTGK